jgi:hypothetical protein
MLPSGEIGNFPTETGMELIIRDESDTQLYHAVLPAQYWTDRNNGHTQFVFDDRDGVVPQAAGLTSVKLKRKNSALTLFKAKVSRGTLNALMFESSVKLRVSFGNDTGADCVMDPDLPCTGTGDSLRCQR